MKKKWLTVCIAALVMTLALASGLAVQAGDHVYFGHYEQDNVIDNGPEPIEWRILEINGNEAMMISQYGLDVGPYSTSTGKCSWEKSTLRAWLNDNFYNAAFTDEDKKCIITKELTTKYEPAVTADPVTLITCQDALRIFVDHPDRRATATPYCTAQGVYVSKKFAPATHYWARNPSWEHYDKASYIAASGGVMKCGGVQFTTNYMIRPLIYFDLTSRDLETAPQSQQK